MTQPVKNRRVNKMMRAAILEAAKFTEADGKSIKRKYFGAVSSYGVSILGSGFDATTLLFANKEYDHKLMQIPSLVENILKSYDATLTFDKSHKEYILDANTALKLAVATYEKIENDIRSIV